MKLCSYDLITSFPFIRMRIRSCTALMFSRFHPCFFTLPASWFSATKPLPVTYSDPDRTPGWLGWSRCPPGRPTARWCTGTRSRYCHFIIHSQSNSKFDRPLLREQVSCLAAALPPTIAPSSTLHAAVPSVFQPASVFPSSSVVHSDFTTAAPPARDRNCRRGRVLVASLMDRIIQLLLSW